jgi:hypothetical protein
MPVSPRPPLRPRGAPEPTTTRGWPAAALLALVVGLAGCAGSSAAPVATSTSSAAADPAPSGSQSPAATAVSTLPTTPPTTSDEGLVVEVRVAGGTVTGPKGRVKVAKGSTVTLKVTSDVADEVHLHGYDKRVDVEKGGTATLTFTADLTGVFEAELESKGLPLVQLQVQ